MAAIDTKTSDQEGRILRARHADLASQTDRRVPFASAGHAAPVGADLRRRLDAIVSRPFLPRLSRSSSMAPRPREERATPVVDASQSIVVDVLGHAPSAGDILTAYAVGGRWVAERGAIRCRFARLLSL